MSELPLSSIKIGVRHRREQGDIAALAENIAEIGLLHPIVVQPDGSLIAGARRLAAFRLLGRDRIPVTVIDLVKLALGEYAENTFRKAFTPSELVDLVDALEPIEKILAKERMIAAHASPGKFPEQENGRTRDRIAKQSGSDKSGRTVEKARAIRDAAKAEPEKFTKLKEDMDRTGRVDGPFKRLKIMKQSEAIRKEPPPLPGRGPYRVIVADPPWPYELRTENPSHRGVLPYASMSIEQIRATDLGGLAHEDCLLWLWTTNHHMREAFWLLDSWGFTQKTILTWAKDRMGMGDWLRGQTEHCLLAVRGRPTVELTNQTTLLQGKVRDHSRKPVEFYEFVERLCPAPRYAYLFSRYQHNENWDCHGDEAP